MALKKYNPTSAGLRERISSDFAELKTDNLPERKRRERRKSVRGLQVKLKKHSGRNNQGRITSRFRGGGHKPVYRLVDFRRHEKLGVPGRVSFFDYDPNRNCRLALIVYVDGDKRYIIAPAKLNVGDEVISGAEAPIKPGNALPLINVPLGAQIHNLELVPGQGAKLVRAAGQSAQLMAKEKGMVAIKLPSGESRWFNENCYATLGVVGNAEHANQVLGKAGAKRWRGRKPHIRGFAMNPNDHKHGGGEGRCPVGAPGPYTFAGKKHGRKTRGKKASDKRIINRRK